MLWGQWVLANAAGTGLGMIAGLVVIALSYLVYAVRDPKTRATTLAALERGAVKLPDGGTDTAISFGTGAIAGTVLWLCQRPYLPPPLRQSWQWGLASITGLAVSATGTAWAQALPGTAGAALGGAMAGLAGGLVSGMGHWQALRANGWD
ncbi:MAG TPA: hypothetical protein VGW38_29010, partial [Chloroflexota bacterium]|nr:hypothetical protein [Chloroflexota bacterium]